MVSAVSKKYTRALTSALNEAELNKSYEALNRVSSALKLSKTHDILNAKNISVDEKAKLIAGIADYSDAKFSNFISLLLKAKRVEIVPEIAEEIREYLSQKTGKAEGKATASFDVDAADLEAISKTLSTKLKRDVSLTFQKVDSATFNGIKVEIDDLGIEVEINKDALKKSLIAHILNTTKIF